jgi:hypothetical protein
MLSSFFRKGKRLNRVIFPIHVHYWTIFMQLKVQESNPKERYQRARPKEKEILGSWGKEPPIEARKEEQWSPILRDGENKEKEGYRL